MKNFIINNYDYRAIATEEDLSVLSDDNSNIINKCNLIAIHEASGYLSTKYDVNKLFKGPVKFVEGNDYVVGDRLYVVEMSVGSPSIPTGELTFYSCIKDVVGATDITDTEYFIEGDIRDQKLLEVIMTIALFYIHKRLSPNNIPTFRIISYDGNGDTNIMSAIKWLTLIQKGELSPYGWEENIATGGDNGDVDVDGDGDIDYSDLGANPANGIMYGNDICKEYLWYDEKYDKNIIIR